MIIAGMYSFNGGKKVVESRFGAELREIEQIIAAVDSQAHKTKVSKEKTMPGRMLYRPGSLNKAFRKEFEVRHWQKKSAVSIPLNITLAGIRLPLQRLLSEKWIL